MRESADKLQGSVEPSAICRLAATDDNNIDIHDNLK